MCEDLESLSRHRRLTVAMKHISLDRARAPVPLELSCMKELMAAVIRDWARILTARKFWIIVEDQLDRNRKAPRRRFSGSDRMLNGANDNLSEIPVSERHLAESGSSFYSPLRESC